MIKPFDYHKLQSRLLKKAGEKSFPVKAMFELTYRCNLRCRHCYMPSHGASAHSRTNRNNDQRELSTREVFIILDQLAAAGCLNLGFTGGEPFLRGDILDILEYAKSKGFNIILLTNGTLITPKKADSLKELGINKIDLSFHTINEGVFDWFVQVPNTYRKVLDAVELLRDRNIDVFLKVTAMTINKNDLVELRHLAVERFGAHFRWGPTVTPGWHGRKENLKFRLRPDEISPIMKGLQDDTEIEFGKLDTLEKRNRRRPKKKEGSERKIDHKRLFRCGAGKTEVTINPYGEMKLCIDLLEPKYHILSGSFSEGWEMLSEYVKKIRPGPSYECQECELVQHCSVCPANRWLECGDLSACPSYYREAAELAKVEAQKNEG